MKWIIWIIIILVIVYFGWLILRKADGPVAVNDQKQVLIKNFSFSPEKLEIKVGDTIVFKNEDPVAHTVTSDTGLFDSGPIDPNENYTRTFTDAGTFSYHCVPHPNMKATIEVK